MQAIVILQWTVQELMWELWILLYFPYFIVYSLQMVLVFL